MKTIKVKFWCNGGDTEEEAFERWLDNNEDVGWEIIKQKK
jgi:hypothetical protein